MFDKSSATEIETRYFFSIAVMDIQGKSRIEFDLGQPIVDKEIIVQILEDMGFRHGPYFNKLIQQAMSGWTLQEFRYLERELPVSATVADMDFANATIYDANPDIPKKGETVLVIEPFFKNPVVKKPDSYFLPFVVLGRYDSHRSRWKRKFNQSYKFIVRLGMKIIDWIASSKL